MVIQVVLCFNPHVTIDCSPVLDSLGDVHIFQIPPEEPSKGKQSVVRI